MSYKSFIQNVIGNRASQLVIDNIEDFLGRKFRDIVYHHTMFDVEGTGFTDIESDRCGGYDFSLENTFNFVVSESNQPYARDCFRFFVTGHFSEYGVLIIRQLKCWDSNGVLLKKTDNADFRID